MTTDIMCTNLGEVLINLVESVAILTVFSKESLFGELHNDPMNPGGNYL